MSENNPGTLARVPYILLDVINHESRESVDYIIAHCIASHMEDLRGASIQEIADACAVSKSTVSRFCRKAGMTDFQELKDELARPHIPDPFRFDAEKGSYLHQAAEQILRLDESLDYHKIHQLIEEIDHSENVLLMGSMQARNPAVNLQEDLYLAGRVTDAPSSVVLQEEAIQRAKAGDLIIVFSNSARFFERMFTEETKKKLMDLRIWMVTGNERAEDLPYVDACIYVPDNHTYVSHPLQFSLVGHVIALAYEDRKKKENQ